MLKSIAAVVAAAVIAGVFTVLSAPSAPVDARPTAQPTEVVDASNGCIPQPWPYLNNCTGAQAAKSSVRLVTTDRSVR